MRAKVTLADTAVPRSVRDDAEHVITDVVRVPKAKHEVDCNSGTLRDDHRVACSKPPGVLEPLISYGPHVRRIGLHKVCPGNDCCDPVGPVVSVRVLEETRLPVLLEHLDLDKTDATARLVPNRPLE